MHVRRAVSGDYDVVCKMCRRIYPRGDYIEDMFEGWVDSESLYVMENDKILGVFAITMRENVAWLQGIRIDAPLQSMGLGTQMYEDAEGIAARLGAGTVCAFAGSKQGLHMLEKAGYYSTGCMGAYVLGDGGVPGWNGFGRVVRGTSGRYLDSWTLRYLNSTDDVIAGDDVSVYVSDSGTSLTVLEVGDSGIANLARYISGNIPHPHGKPQYRWWNGLVVLCVDDDGRRFADAGFCEVGRYPIMEKRLD